jgi:hypothetical protein
LLLKHPSYFLLFNFKPSNTMAGYYDTIAELRVAMGLLADQKLPAVDLQRPAALLLSTEKKQEIAQGKCSTCSKVVSSDEFKTELGKREYGISGMCAKCQSDVFGEPAAPEPEVHHCAVGDCKPVKAVAGPNTGCDTCLASLLSDSVGTISAMEKFFKGSQCYRDGSHCCSVHGQKAVTIVEWFDKHEVWQCSMCKAARDFRVREWVLDGGPCSGYSEL